MKRVTLRLDDDLHAWLVVEAHRFQRSLHGQILHVLIESLPLIDSLRAERSERPAREVSS